MKEEEAVLAAKERIRLASAELETLSRQHGAADQAARQAKAVQRAIGELAQTAWELAGPGASQEKAGWPEDQRAAQRLRENALDTGQRHAAEAAEAAQRHGDIEITGPALRAAGLHWSMVQTLAGAVFITDATFGIGAAQLATSADIMNDHRLQAGYDWNRPEEEYEGEEDDSEIPGYSVLERHRIAWKTVAEAALEQCAAETARAKRAVCRELHHKVTERREAA